MKKQSRIYLKAIEIDSMYVNAHSNLAALYMSVEFAIGR